MNSPQDSTESPHKPERLCISAHQLRHLTNEYRREGVTGSYGAACGVVKAFKDRGIDACIVAGGLDFIVTQENVSAVAEVLATFRIDPKSLNGRTFHEDLVLSGGLEKLATKDPLGHGARVLGMISGTVN